MIQKEIREQDTFIKKIKQAILGKVGKFKVDKNPLFRRWATPKLRSHECRVLMVKKIISRNIKN